MSSLHSVTLRCPGVSVCSCLLTLSCSAATNRHRTNTLVFSFIAAVRHWILIHISLVVIWYSRWFIRWSPRTHSLSSRTVLCIGPYLNRIYSLLFLSHAHTHSQTLLLFLKLTHTLVYCLSHTHKCKLSLSHSLSLSHTHTHTQSPKVKRKCFLFVFVLGKVVAAQQWVVVTRWQHKG